MSKFLHAADTIERELNRLSGLRDAAEAFRRIGSLEQAEQDAKRRHGEIQGKVIEQQVALAALETERRARLVDLEAHVVHARRDADIIKTTAGADAAATRSAAETDALAVRNRAKAEGEKIIAAANAHKADVDALAAQRGVQAVAAQTALVVAERELSELQERIAKAKAEVKRMLG